MKKLSILAISLVMALVFNGCKNDGSKTTEEPISEVSKELALATTSFGVSGNCGMCKSTIEKAANSVPGVASANWDLESHQITVVFDDSQTTDSAIHNAIAASGYKTDKVVANANSYTNLPACCQYTE